MDNIILKELMSDGSYEELDSLTHYGIKRRSGRYPYGSGENPFQHEDDFLSAVRKMRSENYTYTDNDPDSKTYGQTFTGETAIAKSMGLSTTQFRTQLSLASNEIRRQEVAKAKQFQKQGCYPPKKQLKS